jgi:hypothetical protein
VPLPAPDGPVTTSSRERPRTVGERNSPVVSGAAARRARPAAAPTGPRPSSTG